MLSARQITEGHDTFTQLWHQQPASDSAFAPNTRADEWLHLTLRQHLANFELWHAEDEARAPGATDADLARVKRLIDQINQRRNDLAEQLDLALLAYLSGRNLPAPTAELHSETPGLMIDRLSILALKIFHTSEEITRAAHTADSDHAVRNHQRLAILTEQRADLASGLDRLWQQLLKGERRFKLYRQLKMYNDPELNPAIYKTRRS